MFQTKFKAVPSEDDRRVRVEKVILQLPINQTEWSALTQNAPGEVALQLCSAIRTEIGARASQMVCIATSPAVGAVSLHDYIFIY